MRATETIDCGQGVSLRPFVVKEHLEFFLEVLKAGEFALQDAYRPWGRQEWYEHTNHASTLFWTAWDGEELKGVIYANYLTPKHFASINGYGLRQHPYKPALAIKGAVNHLFSAFDLRVVHTDHCVHNRAATIVVTKAGFLAEGLLPEFCVYGGVAHGSLVLGITRAEWLGRKPTSGRYGIHEAVIAVAKEIIDGRRRR